MEKTYQVYVLQNLSGRFYIGLSENVYTRWQQHNDGVSRWTSKYRPWTLVWTSAPTTLSNARKLEHFLKRQKGGHGFFQHTALPDPRSSSGS
jgi:predicted GIY-YIG superfamily endonuclease